MKKISVVGIGPGSQEDMTFRAYQAIEQAEMVVGYKTYVNLIKSIFPEKEFYTTGMRGERARCQKAVELALQDKIVAVISSGDAGIFGMATLVLELAEDHADLDVEIIPGVTAASSGAALLGAPLAHDFATISLSDQLTPWELIEKRVRLCAEADLCLAIYNPSSRERPQYLQKAIELIREYKPADTIAGYARNIGRDNESCAVMTLEELYEIEVDMVTTVFIGNKDTRIINGRMVTPRGYKLD